MSECDKCDTNGLEKERVFTVTIYGEDGSKTSHQVIVQPHDVLEGPRLSLAGKTGEGDVGVKKS